MKFNYKLRRVCGAYYGHAVSSSDTLGAAQQRWSGSNLLYDETGYSLLSSVHNRIQVLDLQSHTVRTLPVEARSNIVRMALLPHDHLLLLVVDSNNYAMLINYHVGVVLHRFCWKQTVRDMQFSPQGGHYVAVSQGAQVQVWCMPSRAGNNTATTREFAPLVLLRTYTGQSDDVTCLAWSSDATVLAAASRDCTVRLWTRETTRHFGPQTLLGHKRPIVGLHLSSSSDDTTNDDTTSVSSDSKKNHNAIRYCYSISQDGAMVTWKAKYHRVDPNNEQQDTTDSDSDDEEQEEDPVVHEGEQEDNDAMAKDDEAVDNFFTGTTTAGNDDDGPPRKRSKKNAYTTSTKRRTTTTTKNATSQAHHLVHATWSIQARHYLSSSEGTGGGTSSGGTSGGTGSTLVTCTTFCPRAGLVAVGYASGLFGIYQLVDMANIHTLSVGSNQLVQTCVLNTTGDWLALACPTSQQLLVWEWKSETYILKQRGHAYGMRCMAYSPTDGIVICTGGEDGKIKLWNATSGFCYVTLEKSHTAPISAVAFANASVVLSASLDGTVRAHDLHRYRTFKTLTTPTPVQFLSLAVDPSGEVVAAGSADPFHVYCWNLQTGKLLDVLTGHTGPVCDLQFASAGGSSSHAAGGSMLVSASWDGTVKLWDVYKTNVPSETLQHTSDVVCVAVRPDGLEICTGTVSGILHFWDVSTGKLSHEMDGRRDVAGGRKMNDARTADNNASSRYFTSVCYSADGACVLAGGNSKYVCIYHVQQQMLLKKFQVTFNRSLDGVLDEVRGLRARTCWFFFWSCCAFAAAC
jgi:periodic tryptophan protein 2